MQRRAIVTVLAIVGWLLPGEWAKAGAPLPKGPILPPTKGPIVPPPKGPITPPVLPAPGPRSDWKMCGNCNGRGMRWRNNRWERCSKCNGRGWRYDPAYDRDWRRRDRRHRDDCFVATAAYGSAWEPNVETLRSFRDKCLMTSPVGRGAVELYYTASPSLADWIAGRPWARNAARVALTPAVIVAGALTGNPGHMAIVGGAVALGFLGIPRLRRALKRRRARV